MTARGRAFLLILENSATRVRTPPSFVALVRLDTCAVFSLGSAAQLATFLHVAGCSSVPLSAFLRPVLAPPLCACRNFCVSGAAYV
jgi:hypothetical protein